MKRICVFCGSSPGGRPEYRAVAEELAADLLRALEEWRPTHVEKWLDRDTR